MLGLPISNKHNKDNNLAGRDKVRIFDANGLFQCWTSPAEARKMRECGEVEAYYEDRPSGPHFVGYRRKGVVASDAHHSPASITLAEVVINAAGGSIAPRRYRQVQRKVATFGASPAWSYVGRSQPRQGIRPMATAQSDM